MTDRRYRGVFHVKYVAETARSPERLCARLDDSASFDATRPTTKFAAGAGNAHDTLAEWFARREGISGEHVRAWSGENSLIYVQVPGRESRPFKILVASERGRGGDE